MSNLDVHVELLKVVHDALNLATLSGSGARYQNAQAAKQMLMDWGQRRQDNASQADLDRMADKIRRLARLAIT